MLYPAVDYKHLSYAVFERVNTALKNGVGKVFIIDGRVEHSIIIEMLTDEGIGTMFTNKRGVRDKYSFFSD